MRTMEEISWGEKDFVSPRYSTSTLGEPLPSSMTLKGQVSVSFLTVGSSKRRPMRRLGRSARGLPGLGDAAGHSLDIEDGVGRVHGSLVLGSLTNQALLVSEADEGRGGEGSLLVGNDLDIGSLVDGDDGVGGTCDGWLDGIDTGQWMMDAGWDRAEAEGEAPAVDGESVVRGR